MKADAEPAPGKREAIMAAATKVFDGRGFAATTMDAIAAEAGIAKGSIYNYFKSKDDLFYQVFEHAVGQSEFEVDQVLSQPATACGKLDRILDYSFTEMSKYKALGRLVLEFWATAARKTQSELALQLREMHLRWQRRIEAILAEGVRRGEFRAGLDCVTAASLIMQTLDGIQLHDVLDLDIGARDAAYLAALKRMILDGLTDRPGGSRPETRA
ncbi:MAG TPA: TetR/AcrR family transcriptional regulator [Phycisphaerae bacterium]|nr:TetR/AcrR family transcriptional regulator [Phycisphaerae bacterium]